MLIKPINMSKTSNRRIKKILDQCIRDFDIDLQGLTVFTEAATGYYLYTPIMAALANADKVYAITSDSKYGSKEEVLHHTSQVACEFEIVDKINVIFDKSQEYVADSDIITNSGFVRPIDRQMISWMKPTAVIPLMWETWEFRENDLDLQACKEREILVMGTDESLPPQAMYGYSGYIAMKLLFELGLEGYKTKILLLGGQPSLGKSIYDHFKCLDMTVTWFADNHQKESFPYEQLREYFSTSGAEYDALIVAEHANNTCLLGRDGLLTYEQITEINPALCIGIITGNVDIEGLKESGLHFFPEVLQSFGYMSYQAYHLGPLPVLELYAAGLKVGEAMARARLHGMSIEYAKKYALSNSPAMDF